jgi:hypothetical protein
MVVGTRRSRPASEGTVWRGVPGRVGLSFGDEARDGRTGEPGDTGDVADPAGGHCVRFSSQVHSTWV